MKPEKKVSVTAREAKVPEFRQDKTDRLQSPYLNLQAAGSTGHDSSTGIHLRWLLNGFLGENHLPKGDYAGNTQFFNKKDDFVYLYRIPYNGQTIRYVSFDLTTAAPTLVHNALRLWVYNLPGRVFYLRFLDEQRYNEAAAAVDPMNDPYRFTERYGDGVLDLKLKGTLSFAVSFAAKDGSGIRCETLSVQNKSFADDEEILSARRSFVASRDAMRVVAENIVRVRFSARGSLTAVRFETYIDLLKDSEERRLIEPIGAFALTKKKDEALTRLEDKPRFKVDGVWLKFNDKSFVRVKNYQDRWSLSGGLEEGVAEYITLSDLDPTATQTYNDDVDPENPTAMDVSLLSFLNAASTDFHIARILGLGYIDTLKGPDDGQQSVYLAVYSTKKDPEDYWKPLDIRHLYMSLPTGTADERLPQELRMDPVEYGLTVSNGTDSPLQITDAEGYTLYDSLRFVRLRARLKNDYRKSVSFFQPQTEFESSKFSNPVFVGFENRKEGDPEWVKPEIAHDDIYRDTDGIPESSPPVFKSAAVEPNYIHQVTTEGVDEYAGYPVNLFSRASGLSNIQRTDKTRFRKANTLKPPANIAVQLIQAENPLMLTSQSEQQWLAAIDPGKTEILCRLTFDYYHIHDLSYRYGNKARIYHKKQLPIQAIGSITSISNNDTGNPYCVVETADYSYISTGEVFTPRIDPAKRQNFIGGSFSYQSKQFIVDDIILTNADGTYPKISLRKIETREAVLVDDNYQVQQIFQSPSPDAAEAFLLVENLADSKNWPETTSNRFPVEIELGLATWTERVETYIDSEGNQRTETVKGIWDTATITASTSESGVYDVAFDTAVVNDHPQYISPDNAQGKMSVNWYRGYIRVHTAGDATDEKQRKDLRVELISEINTGSRLHLVISDPNFSATDANANIKTGAGIVVNFHPGYRAYLRRYAPIGFDQANILPEPDEGTRNTLIGLQTLDTTVNDAAGHPYQSPMGVPAMLSARELIEPKRPVQPIGASFANPPDFYNKANYSFTTEFEHSPWGMVFYRADSNKILSTLYKQETIDQIAAGLPPVRDDQYLGNRWLDLLSFDYSANGGDFGSFPIDSEGNTYKFPNPDIFNLIYDKPADIVDVIQDAIYSTMLPLTEQPLIFKFVKGGNYVPRPTRQTVTDSSGNVLDPDDPAFDQAPMAKKISDTEILFTDFTLDGNMDSQTLYFYVVREMSNALKLGEPSPFIGPIRLLNTRAPEKLNLKRITSQLPIAYNNYETAVVFEVNRIAASQEISKIQILRTVDAAASLTARSMDVVKEIDITTLDLSGETLIFKDDFQNDADIPYGSPLYYRLVGVREIDYVDHDNMAKTMAVFSEATSTLLSNVVDLTRPVAPTLSVVSHTEIVDKITEIDFHWDKTCSNGKYRLYFLNESTWEKLFEIASDDPLNLSFNYACSLARENSSGQTIYHKFKVEAENSSGMVNWDTKIMTFSA